MKCGIVNCQLSIVNCQRKRRREDRRQTTAETTFNQKLLQGVQMLHGAVFSKRAPLVKKEMNNDI